MSDDQGQPPESLLPYEAWAEEAFRQVMVRALQYAAEHGLPGEHHFYITFRTDHPQTSIPPRLRAQYPQEMVVVLQHQYWDLVVDEPGGVLSVGLSFGGVPSKLRIPLTAITAFTDPYARYGHRFRSDPSPVAANMSADSQSAEEPAAETAEQPPIDSEPKAEGETPQVVSLDAFRRRTPPKDQ